MNILEVLNNTARTLLNKNKPNNSFNPFAEKSNSITYKNKNITCVWVEDESVSYIKPIDIEKARKRDKRSDWSVK